MILIEYIHWVILKILYQSNPFDLENTKINYIDDLWDENSWENDDGEKNLIGINNIKHKKLIEYILVIIG